MNLFSKQTFSIVIMTTMGLAFIGVTLPATMGIPNAMVRGEYTSILLLAFPVAGAFLIYRAWQQVLSHSRYGAMPLTLTPDKLAPGDNAKGTILIKPHADKPEFNVSLYCLKTRQRSGRRSQYHQSTLAMIPVSASLSRGAHGDRLDFNLTLPADAQKSGPVGLDRIHWELRVQARGVDRRYNIKVV